MAVWRLIEGNGCFKFQVPRVKCGDECSGDWKK